MTFTEAIERLNVDGGFISRPQSNSCFMELTHGKWLIYMNAEEYDNYPQLFADDYLADDWEWVKG